MISPDWCRMMAAYNSEMNRRLYAAAGSVPDAERKADRGAFFGSIHATLNHLLWGDRMWMSRLAGWERPQGGIPGSTALHADFEALRAARAEADAAIEAWAGGLTAEWLSGALSWQSGATGRDLTMPRWITVAHLFNHQTHHRGQVHCLLTQQGVRPADTDLPFILDMRALGLM
ncbi:DinB family protein [Crenalkalicoccus roseus]|uniref:DinB family protein n=1 Tax=Crenalkalicoccus roseus TaxID=1485588 RepID=UPI001080D8F8|nr:DinB family protein [Crenalkalicoccus roseus]